MSAIEILYIMFLIGSLAFGLEAMLVGLGGKLMIMYHRRRLSILTSALTLGLGIVSLSVVTSIILALEPIYFTLLVLAYSFAAGQLVRALGVRRVKTAPLPELPKTSEKEIEGVVLRRGYKNLVERDGSVKKVSYQRLGKKRKR